MRSRRPPRLRHDFRKPRPLSPASAQPQQSGRGVTAPKWSESTTEKVLLIAILLLAAGLRFYALDGTSLWSDEGNTWALMPRSFGEIAAAAAADIHPPGYYWLLKIWTSLLGTDASALRSLSAIAGLCLVYVVYRIGRFGGVGPLGSGVKARLPNVGGFALLAALLAAVNPFQLYYSQEARMYMLLTLESALLFWALLAIMDAQRSGRGYRLAGVGFVLSAVAGLWTHYSFPALLLAAALTYLVFWFQRRPIDGPRSNVDLLRFGALNLVALFVYLPWFPTAVDRVLNWPKGGQRLPLLDLVATVFSTLLFGPLRQLPDPLWLWLAAAVLLPLLGLIALRRRFIWMTLLLWLLTPLVLMAGLGLFSDAFLKFLLVASPAWCLLAAAAPWMLPGRVLWGQGLIVATALLLALTTLPAYYADPTARDNYAGVAAYVAAVGDPAADLVLLNAPGQQEVWRYYDPGLPILALPRERSARSPGDDGRTGRRAARPWTRLCALLATDEADPETLVEGWLDQHAFKGLESWQGNLRFVVYGMNNDLACSPLESPIEFGGQIALTETCRASQSIAAGDLFLTTLRWQALADLEQRYKVSLQLLDARNQVIAQRDSEPAGGSAPTDGWQTGDEIDDNHGVVIPPGTPPGDYRWVVVLYDAQSGERLRTPVGDFAELGSLKVLPMQRALPLDLLPIQKRLMRPLGAVTLVGYDAYKQGMGHAPETPIAPGDVAHFTFYWQAPDPLPADWPTDLTFQIQVGDQQLTAPLAGGAFPTGAWRPGELVRGEFDLRFDGDPRRPLLRMGIQEYRLDALPGP
ncbi:MAG: hypothetical protein HC802_09080 [Caldilineaceae bacterium]|nr:hypothetical protein [Caldilineaceae bacterium]